MTGEVYNPTRFQACPVALSERDWAEEKNRRNTGEFPMEVILKEDVANLGHRGDVVKVADGYGRNFLLPRKLALQATTGQQGCH
jgi:hypothetical protein